MDRVTCNSSVTLVMDRGGADRTHASCQCIKHAPGAKADRLEKDNGTDWVWEGVKCHQ